MADDVFKFYLNITSKTDDDTPIDVLETFLSTMENADKQRKSRGHGYGPGWLKNLWIEMGAKFHYDTTKSGCRLVFEDEELEDPELSGVPDNAAITFHDIGIAAPVYNDRGYRVPEKERKMMLLKYAVEGSKLCTGLWVSVFDYLGILDKLDVDYYARNEARDIYVASSAKSAGGEVHFYGSNISDEAKKFLDENLLPLCATYSCRPESDGSCVLFADCAGGVTDRLDRSLMKKTKRNLTYWEDRYGFTHKAWFFCSFYDYWELPFV